METVITVMPGKNPDIDQAFDIAKEQVKYGLLEKYGVPQPMGDGIELYLKDNASRDIVISPYIQAGFEIIEEHRG